MFSATFQIRIVEKIVLLKYALIVAFYKQIISLIIFRLWSVAILSVLEMDIVFKAEKNRYINRKVPMAITGRISGADWRFVPATVIISEYTLFFIFFTF